MTEPKHESCCEAAHRCYDSVGKYMGCYCPLHGANISLPEKYQPPVTEHRRLAPWQHAILKGDSFNALAAAVHAAHAIVLATGNEDEEPEASGADIFEMVCNAGGVIQDAVDVLAKLGF